MKNSFIRCLAFLVMIAVILSFSGCAEKGKTVKTFLKYSDDFDESGVPSGVVCENSRWKLVWDGKFKRVSFEDKLSGAVWGQIPSEAMVPQYKEDGMLKKNHPQLESVIQVIYQNPESFDDVTAYSYASAVQSGGVYAQKIKDGISITYDFLENEISVVVEYKIKKDSFEISLDPAKIAEGKKQKVHSVAIAPFICGLKNNSEDSWLFLPDGSGTVIKPIETGEVGSIGEQSVYGKDLAYQTYTKPSSTEQINIPVYGAKKGNNALFAIIKSGAQTATLKWNIGSSNIGYSSVYPQFFLRGFNYIRRPESFVTTTTLGAFKILDDGIITDKIAIEYYSLSDSKASISGMAECYREYLKKNYEFKKSAQEEKSATLKYVGATVVPSFFLGVPSHKLLALTTAEQALEMTDEITAKTGNNINVQLVGFGESGIDIEKIAGGFTVAKKLGGKSGMKELIKQLDKKKINSFFDFDIISFSKSGGGFSKSSAAEYGGGQVVKYTSFDNVSFAANKDRFYVISRDNLLKVADKTIKNGKKIGLSGISYYSLSNTVYSDYQNNDYYINGKIQETATGIFNNAEKSGLKTLSSAANDYVAVGSDYITDVPIYSSNYSVSSYDVPFYEMVFKGYRPMSSVSINLCTDKNDALLRCISSGISPSYTLLKNYESELISSNHSFIFASVYSGNKKEIINSVNDVKEYLKSVSGASITDYVRLDENASLTKFDNGVFAVVNYGEKEIETEYGNVAPKSYITGEVK